MLRALRLFESPAPPTSLIYPALMPALCAALCHPWFWPARALGGVTAPSPLAHFLADPTPYTLAI